MKIIDRVIYKTTNKINKKFYIGQDSYNNPTYLGSGLLLGLAIKKYGRENFVKEIVDRAETQAELDQKEAKWIFETNATDRSVGYNISKDPGRFMLGLKHSDEAKKKIGLASMGNTNTKGFKQSEAAKKKIGLASKGNKNRLGKKNSDSHKEKVSKTLKGHPVLESTREKISLARMGFKMSAEQKLKVSNSCKGRIPWNKGLKKIDCK